ncbi:TPA: hypothetical protein ACH3X2_000720 [Trebouxia sp. C0005]|nr:MAG: thioredoxin-like chloroplastic-like [Trebouxia sp. A1-2]
MRSLHSSSSCSLNNLRQVHEQSRVKPQQWMPHRAFAPASATPRHASLGNRFAMRGILDSWKNMTSRDDSSQSQATISIDEDEPCPLECVRQVYKVKEFQKVVEQAHPKSLIVVDYYRTACGACKYILPGFVKLCKRSGSHDAPVIFLKHNVIDEYDERTELADYADIRAVPSFQFYMNGKLVEQFATRDKAKISLAIDKYVPGAVSL